MKLIRFAGASGLAMAGLTVCTANVPASAQTSLPATVRSAGALQSGASGLSPSLGVSTPPTAPVSSSGIRAMPAGTESLFPGLFGIRPWLSDHGIGVILDSFNDFQGSIAGGGGPPTSASSTTSGGVGVVGQYALETDINWEKLAGLYGFSTHSIILGAWGSKPVSQDVGDALNPTQANYGARGNVVVHFVEAWGEETLVGGRFDIAAGRIPMDDDFFSSPLYCNFENNNICGNPKAGTDNIYHSSYPDSVWAARVRVRPLPQYYVQTGIFFGQDNI
jgi:porin